jgi:ribosomal protein S4E
MLASMDTASLLHLLEANELYRCVVQAATSMVEHRILFSMTVQSYIKLKNKQALKHKELQLELTLGLYMYNQSLNGRTLLIYSF